MIIPGNEDLQEGDTGFIANKTNRSDITNCVSSVCSFLYLLCTLGESKAWRHAQGFIAEKCWCQNSDSGLLIVLLSAPAWFPQSALVEESGTSFMYIRHVCRFNKIDTLRKCGMFN